MKSSRREALADLRAAVTLAQPQALDLALQGLSQQPELAGNQPIEPGFIEQFLLPAGEILSRPAVPWSYLQGLQQDRLAGIRAAAAAAACLRWLAGDEQALPLLERAVADRRPEVAQAVVKAARQSAAQSPSRLAALGQRWLAPAASAPQRAAAYRLLAGLAETQAQELLGLAAAAPAAADESENAALAELLTALGQAGHGEAVLDLLEGWAAAGHQDSWLICRTLAAGWAARYTARALAVLDTLEAHGQHNRRINRTRQALAAGE